MILNTEPALGGVATRIVEWQRQHGRHHLPWQGTRDPYRIWLSEIMLQQTQVGTVVDYYIRFLARFPDVLTLSSASQEEVMPYWAGLGYYARARNLHRCAQVIATDWGGRFPISAEQIATLPGIGRSTAAAIAAFAYGERSAIMDGNVKRVFTRYFGIAGVTSERATEQLLWRTAEDVLNASPANLDMAAYTQGLMDLGSQCCTRSRPDCAACPLQTRCYARVHGRQHELPAPRKKKAVPERQTLVLILEHDGHLLLEKRRSPGIWGGLWSLPEYAGAAELADACLELELSPASARKMAGLLHIFTHFKLYIEPWYLIIDRATKPEVSSTRAWIPLHDLATKGLPAPIRKILEGLYARPGGSTQGAGTRAAQTCIDFRPAEFTE